MPRIFMTLFYALGFLLFQGLRAATAIIAIAFLLKGLGLLGAAPEDYAFNFMLAFLFYICSEVAGILTCYFLALFEDVTDEDDEGVIAINFVKGESDFRDLRRDK